MSKTSYAPAAVTARLREASRQSDLRRDGAGKVDMSPTAVSQRLRQQAALRSASLRWGKAILLDR